MIEPNSRVSTRKRVFSLTIYGNKPSVVCMRANLAHTKNELRDAERATASMRAATTFVDFESAWKSFLVSVQKAWIKLRLECKNCTGFAKWEGPLVATRDSDPLLVYLRQARNADEHTVQDTMELRPGFASYVTETHPSGTTHIEEITFGGHGELTSYKGNVPLRVSIIFPRIVLLPFTNKSVRFEVPETHLGLPIADGSPLGVAALALKFYTSLVDDAERTLF